MMGFHKQEIVAAVTRTNIFRRFINWVLPRWRLQESSITSQGSGQHFELQQAQLPLQLCFAIRYISR